MADDGTAHLFFDAPLEAPTTRGFASILQTGLDGLSAQEVLATPAEFTTQLGLSDLVSPLRLRGMAAMLARIKRQIQEQQAGAGLLTGPPARTASDVPPAACSYLPFVVASKLQ